MILKLKRTPGIYVVGFMGAGKTTIGRCLAERIGWHFGDLDDDIVAAQGVSVAEIFDTRGEAEYRRLETDAIRARVRRIECGQPTVLALGGGAFIDPVNHTLLKNNGVTVWLDCPRDVVERRLSNATDRPLARDMGRFRALYEERRGVYSGAEFRVEIGSDDPMENVERILELSIFK